MLIIHCVAVSPACCKPTSSRDMTSCPLSWGVPSCTLIDCDYRTLTFALRGPGLTCRLSNCNLCNLLRQGSSLVSRQRHLGLFLSKNMACNLSSFKGTIAVQPAHRHLPWCVVFYRFSHWREPQYRWERCLLYTVYIQCYFYMLGCRLDPWLRFRLYFCSFSAFVDDMCLCLKLWCTSNTLNTRLARR